MLSKIQNFWNDSRTRRFTDVRNIGLYVFALIVLAITWSAAKTVQGNYELQKEISVLKQQNEVLKLYNQNTSLQNQYLQTDQYLELSARQNFGLAAPGEKVLLVPASVAAKYVDTALMPSDETKTAKNVDSRPEYQKNLEAWRDFLLGRKIFSD
jgi:cell division protein FtsB